MEKVCIKCLLVKNFSQFHNRKITKDRKNNKCIVCCNEESKKYYIINIEKIKRRKKKYYLENQNFYCEYAKKYRYNNKNKRNHYQRERRKNDLHFKLRGQLTRRIGKALKYNKKTSHTIELLGCSLDFLKSYFESKFTPQMTWQDFLDGKIHLDHVRPCASFNLSKPEEQKECFHYTNLQPLWATTEIARQNGDFESIGNINKSDKIL